MDSVLNKKTLQQSQLFTFNIPSGVEPKFNLHFLNNITAGALIIFSAEVQPIGPRKLRVYDEFT